MNFKESYLINNSLSEIAVITDRLEKLGENFNLPQKIIFDITLSMDELLTNIISYAYQDNKNHKIRIDISLEKKYLTLVIVDDGIPFNPLEKKSVDLDNLDLETMEIGGLGIHFIKTKIDEIFYQRIENKNELTLKKIIKE